MTDTDATLRSSAPLRALVDGKATLRNRCCPPKLERVVQALFLLASLLFLTAAAVHVASGVPFSQLYFGGTALRVVPAAMLLVGSLLNALSDVWSVHPQHDRLAAPSNICAVLATACWVGGAIGLTVRKPAGILPAGGLWFAGSMLAVIQGCLMVAIEVKRAVRLRQYANQQLETQSSVMRSQSGGSRAYSLHSVRSVGSGGSAGSEAAPASAALTESAPQVRWKAVLEFQPLVTSATFLGAAVLLTVASALYLPAKVGFLPSAELLLLIASAILTANVIVEIAAGQLRLVTHRRQRVTDAAPEVRQLVQDTLRAEAERDAAATEATVA